MAEQKIQVGDKVSFNHSRVHKGNPVEGIVVDVDPTWIDVQLFKDIEGFSTSWKKGETKAFRFNLIDGQIEIL